MDRANVKMNKPQSTRATRTIDNPEHRDNPAANFGLEVEVRRGVGNPPSVPQLHNTNKNRPDTIKAPQSFVGSQDATPSVYPSGVPRNNGQGANFPQGVGPIQPGNQNYREVIPPGQIGSVEKYDMQMPAAQYVDTVPWTPDETLAPRLHGAMDALRAADTREIEFADYARFQPRSAPLPRARQDESVLGNMAYMSADPLMTDEDSFTMIIPRDDPRRKDLYGDNRCGMLHNQNEDTTPPEDMRANLAKRRGQAAASMPPGQAKRDFIAAQGEAESKGMTSLGYKRLSEEAGRKGY